MNDALSDAIKEAYALAPCDMPVVETLQLFHPLIADSVFLVRDLVNREFTLETGENKVFKACAFDISLPGTDPELSLTICNVDRQVTEFVELASQPPSYPVEVIFRPYFLDSPEAPAMNPPLTMFMADATVNLMTVTGRATFMDVVNRKFPNASEYYTLERFPGI